MTTGFGAQMLEATHDRGPPDGSSKIELQASSIVAPASLFKPLLTVMAPKVCVTKLKKEMKVISSQRKLASNTHVPAVTSVPTLTFNAGIFEQPTPSHSSNLC